MKLDTVMEVTENLSIEVFREAAEDGTLGTVTGVLARGDMINRNRRYYPTEVFRKAAEAAKEDLAAGKVYGLLGHPDWNDGNRGRAERIAIRWDSIELEGNDVIGTGAIVGTQVGQELSALRKAKVALGLSTNGTGSSRYVPAKEVSADYVDPEELIQLMNDDYRFLTIDVVNDPSNVHAAINKEALDHLATVAREKEQEKNMTLEELKSNHADLVAQIVAETKGAENTDDLTARLVQLETENREMKEQNRIANRINLSREMLAAADLPKVGMSGDIDLDARFRTQLETAAIDAADEESAREAVTELITERQALLALGGKAKAGGNPGVPRREMKTETDDYISNLRSTLGL